MEAEIKSFSKKAIHDVDVKKGIVTGYLNRYGNADNVNDIILPGAGKKTISERGVTGANLIKHLWNHNSDQPVAKYTVLEEKQEGVYFEAIFSKTQAAQDKLTLIDEGIVTTNSFGYNVLKSYDENGIRYIQEYKMWEGSSVSIAANDLALITSVKGMSAEDLVKTALDKITALKQAIRKSEATDEAIEQLYWEAQKAEQYLQKIAAKPEDTTSSDPEPPKGTQELEELSAALDKLSIKL